METIWKEIKWNEKQFDIEILTIENEEISKIENEENDYYMQNISENTCGFIELLHWQWCTLDIDRATYKSNGYNEANWIRCKWIMSFFALKKQNFKTFSSWFWSLCGNQFCTQNALSNTKINWIESWTKDSKIVD